MRSLRHDLLERRLWPLAVLIVAAIVAVPFVLHGRRANAAIAPPPPAKGGQGPATGTGAHHATPARHHEATPTSGTRDPFQPVVAAKSHHAASTSTTSTTSTTTSTTPSAPSTASTTPATTTPATTTPAVTSPATSPTTTTPPKTTTTESWDIYSADLRVGAPGKAVAHRDIALLTPLPSARTPEVMYMGVADHGSRAVFALGAGVAVRAIGVERSAGVVCSPTRTDCALIAVPDGKSVGLAYVSATGATHTFVLRLVHIGDRVTHSASVLATARHHVSTVGMCDLRLGDPIGFFDPANARVKLPSTAMCRHTKLAVPFPGTLGAGSSVQG